MLFQKVAIIATGLRIKYSSIVNKSGRWLINNINDGRPLQHYNVISVTWNYSEGHVPRTHLEPSPDQPRCIIIFLLTYQTDMHNINSIEWCILWLCRWVMTLSLTERFMDCQSGSIAWKSPTATISRAPKYCPIPTFCIRAGDYNSECWIIVVFFYWCPDFININTIPFILRELYYFIWPRRDLLPNYSWLIKTNSAQKGCIASNKYILWLRILKNCNKHKSCIRIARNE